MELERDLKNTRWTPIEPVPSKNGSRYWLMRCECGTIKEVNWQNYLQGKSISCGCYRNQLLSAIAASWLSKPVGEASRNSLLLSYKKGAKKRGVVFDLTVAQFTELTSSRCHFCNRLPNRSHYPIAKGVNGPYQYNGIDRRDNSLGYTVDNCLAACTECNRAKNTMSYEDFITYLDALVEFRRNNGSTAPSGN